MNAGRFRILASLHLAALLLLAACASQDLRIGEDSASAQAVVESRAISSRSGSFVVSTSVPSEEEALRIFGVPLADRGVQAVWLRIKNEGSRRARFAPYSIDPEYFPPHEIAYVFRKRYSRQARGDLETHLLSLSMPRVLPPDSVRSGYVFTHADPGTKAFNVDIHYTSGDLPNEHFTFFVEVPGFTPDHAAVDFKSLYEPEDVEDLSIEEFRAALADWPCCTSNREGSGPGRPWTVAFIAPGPELLSALLRAEWQETSLDTNPNYLNNIDYMYGRPPDARFKKMRDEGSNRNEMILWLAPVRVDGKPVWIAQVNHAISRFFGLADYFFGARIDPDMDEGRNFLLQNFWYAQSLEAFAFSKTGVEVPVEEPRLDFNGMPWFSDSYRLILWISGEPVGLHKAHDLRWDDILEARRAQP